MKWISFLVAILLITNLSAITKEDIPIHPCGLNKVKREKASIAIATIFQNEGPYLKEWIEYHQLIGVKHFYLYNNLSNDEYWSVLKPYVERGVVELFDVPFDSSVYKDGAKTHNLVQITCYNHALAMAKKSNKWLAILDSDEFICPVQNDQLLPVLKKYKGYGGVVVYWQLYGTSRVWEIAPHELMLEKLLYKFPETFCENRLFKSIVQPKYVREVVDPHACSFKDVTHAVMPDFTRFTHHPKFSSPPIDIIRINHYTYRTESYYHNVKKPRRALWGYQPSPELEKERMDLSNSTYDPVMLRFVPQLKKAMGK